MKIGNKNKYKELYLPQILSLLKKELKAKKIVWSDEANTVDSIQFNLSYKGWYMQCAIEVYQPYTIQYRLVGWKNYKKCAPCKFVGEVEPLLVH